MHGPPEQITAFVGSPSYYMVYYYRVCCLQHTKSSLVSLRYCVILPLVPSQLITYVFFGRHFIYLRQTWGQSSMGSAAWEVY